MYCGLATVLANIVNPKYPKSSAMVAPRAHVAPLVAGTGSMYPHEDDRRWKQPGPVKVIEDADFTRRIFDMGEKGIRDVLAPETKWRDYVSYAI